MNHPTSTTGTPLGEKPEHMMNEWERLLTSPDPRDQVRAERAREFRLWCLAVPVEDTTDGGLFP